MLLELQLQLLVLVWHVRGVGMAMVSTAHSMRGCKVSV